MLRVRMFGPLYARNLQQFKTLTQDEEVTANIEKVFGMIVQGKVEPAIQQTRPLSEVPDAIHRLEQREVVGKIVIRNQL